MSANAVVIVDGTENLRIEHPVISGLQLAEYFIHSVQVVGVNKKRCRN